MDEFGVHIKLKGSATLDSLWRAIQGSPVITKVVPQ